MVNVLCDGNYWMHKTFGVFGGFGAKNPADVLKTEGEQAMFIRKIATDLTASLKLIPHGGRLVFTLDSRSWRKDVEIEDGGYKSNRVKDETVDWTSFFDLAHKFGEHLESQGFIFSKVNGAEGDDLLYFWSDHFNSIGEDCIILSGDKDMHQLARHNDNGWTIIWNSNSKNNVLAVPPGWTEEWLNVEAEPDIFNMDALLSPDKEKLKDLAKKAEVVEVNRRDFVFTKMLTGDKGDAVPSVWCVSTAAGKSNSITPLKAASILESLSTSEWKDADFEQMLSDERFMSWVAGFVLRSLKDLDNGENREKVKHNLLRNYKLMWLDKSVMPQEVVDGSLSEIERGIKLPKRTITTDRVKILEGSNWVTPTYAPKAFDPFNDLL
jgi:5'-3' exonuclease